MRKTSLIFWSVVCFLIVSQLLFTVYSLPQIRYEEIAESIRNVFWLQQRQIFDGTSSNIGWYGTSLVIYNLFGFALNTVKYYRLILAALSLICLALTLKKFFGLQKALIPLITIGLSPTLLYFNTLQTSYGVDLQYLPIIIYLIISLNPLRVWLFLVKQLFIGVLTMVAWMSYPTVLFYLPSLAVLYFYQLRQKTPKKEPWLVVGGISVSLIAFLLPLIIGFFWVENRQLLVYDPRSQNGIFRGAGTLQPDVSLFLFNLSHQFSDLFIGANSYYYDIRVVDFSWLIPCLAVLVTIIVSLFLIRSDKKRRLYIILPWLVLLLNLFLASLSSDPSDRPGMRRITPLLASLYALIVFLWYYLLVRPQDLLFYLKQNLPVEAFSQHFSFLKTLLIILLLMIPAHHVAAFSLNFTYQQNLGIQSASVVQGLLDTMVSQVKNQDLRLACVDANTDITSCRYQEMYAEVAGACLWNHLNCHNILGYDPKTQQDLPLSYQSFVEENDSPELMINFESED